MDHRSGERGGGARYFQGRCVLGKRLACQRSNQSLGQGVSRSQDFGLTRPSDDPVDFQAGLETCFTTRLRGRHMRFVFVRTFAVAVICLLAQVPSSRAQTAALKNAIGMEFVKIPVGEFVMGCSTGDNMCKPEESPAHKVRITKVLEMGKYEVTQAEWKAVMNA